MTEFKRKLSEPITLPESVLPREYAIELCELINEFEIRFGSDYCQEHRVKLDQCFIALLTHNKEIAIEIYEECEDHSWVAERLAERNMWDTLAMLYIGGRMDRFHIRSAIKYTLEKDASHETLEQLVVHFDKAMLQSSCGARHDLLESIESISNPLIKGINKVI
jgi:hypothetical protein